MRNTFIINVKSAEDWRKKLYQALLFRFGLIIPVFLRNFADVIL